MYGNIILDTDSYKYSHKGFLPNGTTNVHSYFEARTGGLFPETVFFGLQYLLHFLEGEVLCRPDIIEAKDYIDKHLGPGIFEEAAWSHLLVKHEGKLPIRICAVPEGLVLPVGNVLMTIENTDPDFYWLPNFLETYLSRLWYPCTVATLSRAIKILLATSLTRTGDISGLPFKLHNFGSRGATSGESAGISDMAHLVNFRGTDTVLGLQFAREYYAEDMAGFSIPATEHMIPMAFGEEHERDYVLSVLRRFPNQMVAMVADTYDVYRFCEMVGSDAEINAEIMKRTTPVVIRPDSGKPDEVLPRCFAILATYFPWEKNMKGFDVLDSRVRLIWGDGNNLWSIRRTLQALEEHKISTDNVAFGCGAGLVQDVNRDTCRFAFKPSEITINGEVRSVAKHPSTDKSKSSKSGRFSVWRGQNTGKIVTGVPSDGLWVENLLKPVFENGVILRTTTLAEIRERAEISVSGDWPELPFDKG